MLALEEAAAATAADSRMGVRSRIWWTCPTRSGSPTIRRRASCSPTIRSRCSSASRSTSRCRCRRRSPGRYVLKQRVGTLDPKKLATLDLAPSVRRRSPRSTASPARWPSACASSPRSSPRTTAATRRGSGREAADGADLKKRIGALPGFGEMKITSLGAVLAKQFGVDGGRGARARRHPTLGDVDSPEALERYQAAKRAHKAELRAGVPETPESSGSARTARCGHRRSRSGRPGRSTGAGAAAAARAAGRGAKPRATARAASAAGAARRRRGRALVGRELDRARARGPSGLPIVVLLETRAHYDFPDLPRRARGRARADARARAARRLCGRRHRQRARLPLGRRERALPHLVHGASGADAAADRLVRGDLGRRAAAGARRVWRANRRSSSRATLDAVRTRPLARAGAGRRSSGGRPWRSSGRPRAGASEKSVIDRWPSSWSP